MAVAGCSRHVAPKSMPFIQLLLLLLLIQTHSILLIKTHSKLLFQTNALKHRTLITRVYVTSLALLLQLPYHGTVLP